VHDIGVTWHECPEHKCSRQSKREGDIKLHRAHVHGVSIGVTWHACTALGCEYKAKEKGSIKTHRAAVHDIDVLWWFCNVEGCEHRAKSKKQHHAAQGQRPQYRRAVEAVPRLRLQGEEERPPQDSHQAQAHVQVRCSAHQLRSVTLSKVSRAVTIRSIQK